MDCLIWTLQVSFELILGLSENLKLSEANFTNFSIIVENEHLLIIPRKTYDPGNDNIQSTNNSMFVESLINTSGKSKNCLNLTENEVGKKPLTEPINITKKKKETFWSFCCLPCRNLFSRKK